jgi:hypothetical protein
MNRAVLLFLALPLTAALKAAPSPPPANVFESAAAPVAGNPLDRTVFFALARMGILPVLCSDGVFVRRAYLDVIGTLPTAAEAREFIQDPDLENKYRRLIDRLLEREEFADYWAMRWSDTLRIKAEFPVNLWPNAAQAYHRWVRASIAANKPYDQFVRELLTSSGSNFRVGPVNFYRAIQNRNPEGVASAVALTFMGARAESWPEGRLAGVAAFFSQIGYKPTSEWKEEHVFWDPIGLSANPGSAAPGRAAIAEIGQVAKSTAPAGTVSARQGPASATFPDGTEIILPPNRDPRDVFADWLITPRNPWFTRSIVNRVWAWLVGRGIIHEPDDIRPDNPPSNPALLAYLEKEFVAARYDLKALYRLILNSQTYRLSSLPHEATPAAEANFASYPLRRLDAEVLIDAINAITGTSDLYTSAIPEPFTYIPENQPAIAIADGSITSPFLALFGRSARATGMANERDHKPVPAQWLHLLNSSHIQRKLEQGPKLKAIVEARRKPAEITEELYLTILSRFPTPQELRNAEAYSLAPPPKAAPPPAKSPPSNAAPPTKAATPTKAVASSNAAKAAKQPPKAVVAKRREDWTDLAWSLINSTEFLYRH